LWRICPLDAEALEHCDEQAALEPFQPGLFDDLIDG
jgi:hypothetical protein